MNLSLADLRLFVLLAHASSLSDAARRAQLTPAAVSAALQRLEREADARLLERSTRACRLTDAGRVFLGAVQQALDGLQQAQAELGGAAAQRGRELRGTVRLAAPTDLMRERVSPLLDSFQRAHPAVQVQVRLADAVHDLLRDELDLALRYGELPDSSLVARPVAVTRRVTCASPGYWRQHGQPRVPAELVRHNCLLYAVGGRLDDAWRFGQPAGQPGETVVRVRGDRVADDSALVKLWALQGRGVIQKSDLDLLDELASGRLVAALADHPGTAVPLSLVSRHRRLPAACRALADHLVQGLASALALFRLGEGSPARLQRFP